MNQVQWRNRLFAVLGAVVAVWVGNQVAQEDLFWPGTIAGTFALVIVARAVSLHLGTVLLGIAAFGYIAGNRGFAQVSLSGVLPILPAEFVLLVTGSILVCHCAVRRELPVRRDTLNVAILIWMALSSVRLIPDLRLFGAMALRDYAVVYYAAYFFIAQEAARDPVERGFLQTCILTGSAALLILYPLFVAFPDFFTDTLVLRGNPLIYFKADLVGTFMAMGSMMAFLHYERRGSRWAFVLSLLLAAATMSTNNRASMLSLVMITAMLALGGRRRYLKVLGLSAIGAVIALLLVAQVRDQPFEKTALYGAYERVVSVVDPNGERTYSGEDTSYKGDNNVFRSTWWRIVFDETVRTNPWGGLGWGYDLAEPFAKVYYPEGGEDFSARSPHDVFMTVFARTGIVGLIPFAAIVACIVVGSIRSLRSRDSGVGLWCSACGILVGASFGVVLEGPMGAVVFWTVLGMANAASSEEHHVLDTTQPVETPVANTRALGSHLASR